MDEKPPILIHSSLEGISIARAIQYNLDYFAACKIWNQGVFGLGRSNMENLIREARLHTYAILVVTGDDAKTRRGQTGQSPSDNVVFELGLFFGLLGLDRTFVVYDRDQKPMLPSDLDGLGIATYSLEGHSNPRSALGAACYEIEEMIRADQEANKPNPRLKIV